MNSRMLTAGNNATRLLRLAGWLQIGLAMTMGVALALTWRMLLAEPVDLGVQVRCALVSAEQTLAGVENTLQTNQVRILDAEKQVQGYALSIESTAGIIDRALPLVRAWGEDSRKAGTRAESVGGAGARLSDAIAAKVGMAKPLRVASEGVVERGANLRKSGDAIVAFADQLETDILPKVRQTAETLQHAGGGEIGTTYRQVLDSVGSARATIQRSMGMVRPALGTARLTCGVYAAMTLVLLSCGVTTVLLGHALAVEGGDRQ